MSRQPYLLLTCLLLAAPAAAQRLPAAAEAFNQHSPGTAASARSASGGSVAVVASMLVPGAGQWLQGQSRWVPYVAVEVWSWLRFGQRRSDWRRLTERYRDRAWLVARRVSVGARRDTVFEYYEALTHYNSSGSSSACSAVDGVQPEQDTATFNGDQWRLARGLYYPRGHDYPPGSGEYEAALGYYRLHCIPAQYAWAWGSPLEQSDFANLIVESDDAYRDGTRLLGLILANHVASTVDALITARLRSLGSERTRFRSSLLPEAAGTRLLTEVRITF